MPGDSRMTHPLAIPLTQGQFAAVDEADFESVSRHSWCFDQGYAWAKIDGRKESLHAYLMRPCAGMQVDHINQNGLDNRRCNLRVVEQRDNCWNREGVPGSTSSFKGVSWDRRRLKWVATIRIRGRNKNLGRFESEVEAARAYDAAALKHSPDTAYLNFPLQEASGK